GERAGLGRRLRPVRRGGAGRLGRAGGVRLVLPARHAGRAAGGDGCAGGRLPAGGGGRAVVAGARRGRPVGRAGTTVARPAGGGAVRRGGDAAGQACPP